MAMTRLCERLDRAREGVEGVAIVPRFRNLRKAESGKIRCKDVVLVREARHQFVKHE
jgi:hypothetical protein